MPRIDTEVPDTYLAQASVDQLGADKTALNSVQWDRVEEQTNEAGVIEVVGHNDTAGISKVIDQREPEAAPDGAQAGQEGDAAEAAADVAADGEGAPEAAEPVETEEGAEGIDAGLRSAREQAEQRFPFIKKFRDVAVARSKVENKGGMGEFVGPDDPNNPVPGKFTITIGENSKNLQGGVADTIVADMVHAAADHDPEFQELTQQLRHSLSNNEIKLARRRFENDFKGKFSGTNFENFDNFLNTFWIEGMVQHLLLPENSEIDQIRKQNPDAVPVLQEIHDLFLREPEEEPPIPEPAGLPEREDPGTLDDIRKGIRQGVNDAAEEVLKTTRLDKVADFLEEKFPLGEIEFELPETTAGQVAAPLAQGIAGMIPAARATRALGAVSSFWRWVSAGVLTDFAAFSPDDPGLGDIAKEIGGLDNETAEAVRRTVADAFAKNASDSEFTKRLKNVGEGVLTGAAIDGLGKLYRGLKGARKLPPKALKLLGLGTAADIAPDPAEAKGEFFKELAQQGVSLGTEIDPSDLDAREAEETQVAGILGKMLRPFLGRAGRELADRPPKPAPPVRPTPEEEAVEQAIERTYSPYRPDQPVVEGIDFNMANIETSDQAKELIDTVSTAYAAKIDVATQGVVPHEVTRQVADLIGGDEAAVAKAVSGLPSDVKGLHVRALVMRDVLVASAEQVDRMAHKINNNPTGVSDDDLIAFRGGIARHAALQANMKGVQTEIARALSAFRIPADAPTAARGQMAQEAITRSGGRTTAAELAKLWVQTPVPQRAALAEKGLVAKSVASLRELWINGLLSSVRTHEVNLFSNIMFTAWQVPERAVAGAIGGVKAGLRSAAGKETTERVFLMEAPAMLHGWVEGIGEGFRLGWSTFKTGEPASGLGKIENVSHRAISAINWGLDESSLSGRFVDLVGVGVRLPGRFLMASDEFQKGLGRRMELRAQAYRLSQADLEQGGTVQNAARIYGDALSGEGAAGEAADQFADMITFTKALGEGGQALQKAAAKVPGAWLIMPFIRTPANILKEFIGRTPASPFLRENRQDLLAGGARRDLALAKISTGTSAMAFASYMSSQGIITGGGPSDPRMRKSWLQKFSPYSVKFGDKWYPYGRLEPLGMLFGVAADLTEYRQWAPRDLADEATEALTTRAIVSVLHRLSEKTFFTGLSDFAAAYQDPERYGEAWVARLTGSMMPFSSGVRDIESALDPERSQTRRDPYEQDPVVATFRSILNEYKARTPGFNADLPDRLNHWGEEIRAYDGSWVNAFNAFAPRRDKSEPIDDELIRLRYPLSMPQRKAHGVKLSPERYHTLVKAMNEITIPVEGKDLNMRDYLSFVVQSPLYKAMPSDELKIGQVKDVRGMFLEEAKSRMVRPGSKFFDSELFSWAIRAQTQKPLGIPFQP